MAGSEADGTRLDVDVSPTSRGAADRLWNEEVQMHLRGAPELTESLPALVREDPHVGACADREQHVMELVPEIVARIDLRQVVESDYEVVLGPDSWLADLRGRRTWRCARKGRQDQQYTLSKSVHTMG